MADCLLSCRSLDGWSRAPITRKYKWLEQTLTSMYLCLIPNPITWTFGLRRSLHRSSVNGEDELPRLLNGTGGCNLWTPRVCCWVWCAWRCPEGQTSPAHWALLWTQGGASVIEQVLYSVSTQDKNNILYPNDFLMVKLGVTFKASFITLASDKEHH